MKRPVFGLMGMALLLSCAARAAELPEGYAAVDGIASTTGGKQYILTDYVPSSCNITIEATVVLTKWSTQGIWCSRVGTNDRTMTLFAWSSGNYFRTDRNANTGVYANLGATLNEPTVLRADYANRTFSVDGTESANLMGAGDFTPAAKLAFFASHSNGGGWGNHAEMALLGAKIYAADGTLECEFVPVRCAEQAGTAKEFGLYEVVSGKYYPSAATTGFAEYVNADAEFTEETDDGGEELLVLTVADGIYSLTDADRERIEASGRTLVLRGGGSVVSGSLANFTGDIVLESGVWQVTAVNGLGADNVGKVVVKSGATLEMACTTPKSVVGKQIYLEGTGFNSALGAFYSCSAAWNSLSGCEFRLTGDTYVNQSARIDYYKFFDTCGYNLRFSGPTSAGIGGSYFTNSAARASTMTVVGNRMIVGQANGKHYRGTAEDRLCLTSGANYPMDWRLDHDWTLEFQHGAMLPSTTLMYPNTETAKGCLAGPGPVVLSGTVKAGDGELKSTGTTNFVTTIAAPLRGSGRLEVDPGWLNLKSADNTYSGTISVKGRSDTARAGIRVYDGAGYAAEQTLIENADFEYQASAGLKLGDMEFSGARSTLTGGHDPSAAGSVRIDTLAKTGDGALTVVGNPAVGAAAVRAGTLALERRYYGHAGLMEGKYVDPTSGGQAIWCSRYDNIETKIGEDNWTYSPGGATKILSGYNSEVVDGVMHATAIAYRGYLWNRNATNETWTFALHMNYRMIMRLNDTWTPWTNSGEKGTNLWTTTVMPGANPILIYSLSANWNATQVPSSRFDGLGLSYCREPVDAEQPDPTQFVRLDDGGSGWLLTVDDTDDLLAGAALLPQFETLTFGPQTTFDLKGNILALADLRGQPAVTDVGGLGLMRWTLTDESVAVGQSLTADGPLAFVDGAVIDLDCHPLAGSEAMTQRLAAGMTIASAETIVGEPALSPQLVAAGATLTKSADGKSLTLQLPAQKSVAISDGVFTAMVRNGSGETRVRIYRDGLLVEEILLGAGHRRSACEWRSTEPGLYMVEVEQIDAGAEEGEYVTSQGVIGTELLVADAVPVAFVAPDGDDGNDGFTRETAKASVQAAVEALPATGGTVYVLPGTYVSSRTYNAVDVSNAVAIVGWTIDPSQVVLAGKSGTNARLVRLAHADAALRMVTLSGGYTWTGTSTAWTETEGTKVVAGGGNVYITPAGGTVENCILLGGVSGSWDFGGGNAYLRGGRIANCVLDGGIMSNGMSNDQWRFCGASVCVRGDGTIENCWIRNVVPNAASEGNPYAIGLYDSAQMINCTVTGNTSYFGTIVVGGAGVRIYDTAIYDNVATAEDHDEFADLYVRTSRSGYTSVDPVAAFVACAATRAINETCLAAEAPGFTDAAGGDYTLTAGSPLIDAGSSAAVSGRTGSYDLLGAPRVTHGRVDIGCFEFRTPKLKPVGAVILVR
ncbi:MAG: choice-of-anchor Q domain-containing protein [Kiritimatiellia bacterium]